MYLYGLHFELVTDHKPLQFIFSTRSKPSARIERWVLRLQAFSYTVKHVSGPNNIADCLSRLVNKDPSNEHVDTESFVHWVAETSTPTAMTIREIERASAEDQELSSVRQCLLNKSYIPIRLELSAVGQVVLRGTRIVIRGMFII